ncbi:hypothetical protein NQ318_003473 [Aromia moschata]|uniref:Pseudouridine synthase RsuA/RluA-like domain-containing protein n=1 Tax=Aromia moschata TaxID=1265417 RepID=A0AAV8YV64_9CUCU|nr:hypothetical protein NQ318_003473 [Aromia moschata]
MRFLSYLKEIFNNIVGIICHQKIKILHKSSNFIIINKECDIKINSNNKTERTVHTMLKEVFPLLANEKLFHEYYFPHRLDFATSGLMCIPIHKEACRVVSSTFLTRASKKYYIAIVRGLFSKEIVDIDIPIGEDIREKNIQKMCTANCKFCMKARTAKTIFIVLEKGLYDNYPATKVLVRPITGRRHQIRVHCTYIGHTIVGDYTYSNRKDTKPPRMFLHCLR